MKPMRVPTLVLAAVVALPLSALANHEPGHKPVAGTRSGGEGPTRSPGGTPAGVPDDTKHKATAGTRSGGEGPTRSVGDAKGGVPLAGAPSFTTFDKNNDGSVSSEEAKSSAELTRRFKTLDKDGDGKLSAQEYGAWSGRTKPTAGSATGGEGFTYPPKK